MKKIILMLLFLLISANSLNALAEQNDPIKAYSKKIKINNTTRTVNVVDVDLKDKSIKVEAAMANDTPKTVEEFSSLINRKNAVAAINANFFAAYSDFSTVGAIAHDGMYIWRTYYGTSVGISKDNEVLFFTNDFLGKAKLFINQVEQIDFLWYYDREDLRRNTILFRRLGSQPVKVSKGVCVTVQDGFISEIKYAPAEMQIAEGSYVLYFNMDVTPELKNLIDTKYKLGNHVYHEHLGEGYGFIDKEKYGEIITAGPRLLVDGKVEVDPMAESFKEKKIIEYRAQRSALGLTEDNRLLMITVSNVTIYELADIMKELGAYQAMNLDGGASSGLYAKGKMITAPGRKLNTFLIIKKE